MIVCHCTGATDREVRQAASLAGGDRNEALRACGAGACCGGCRPTVIALLQDADREGRGAMERPAARD